MTENRQTLSAILEGYAEVERVVHLVGRVLVKYPRHTVPSDLDPFLDARYPHVTVTSIRLLTDNQSLIVTVTGAGFGPSHTVCFPADWLDMQESQVTSAVRARYWGAKQNYLHGAARSLERAITDREQRIEREQRAQERDRAELKRLQSALEKTARRG